MWVGNLDSRLTPDVIPILAAYAVTGTDGLLVHRDTVGDAMDPVAMSELYARLLCQAASRMMARNSTLTEPLGSPVRGG